MAASDADRSAGGLRAAAYRAVLRPVLFRAGGSDAERAHQRTLTGLSRAARSPRLLRLMSRLTRADPGPRRVFGVDFPAVTGLAAGMDKDAVALKAWPALGFGHVEVGTVTAHAQPGNARPRLFRLVESGAVINRMGFNNAGAEVLAGTLRAAGPIGIPVGVSLGKSKVTPVEAAVGDYLTSLRHVYRHADYVAVNVSSPNTPGLRTLQDAGPLDELLGALTAEAGTLAAQDGSPDHPTRPVPVLVKIAPDLTDEAIDELLGVCVDHGIAGLIATNTTIGRPGIAAAETSLGAETGGLSGRPLTERALQVVRYVAAATDLPVIAVGGIMTVDDGLRMLDAGASLLQVYTGFIYAGPPLVTGLNRAAARQAAANPVP